MKLNILNNKKAISPIISVLILVLIVVGAAGGFYLFFNAWQSGTQENINEMELKPNLVLPSYKKDLTSIISALYTENQENYIIDDQEAYNEAIIRSVSFGNIKLGIISRNLNSQEKSVFPDLDMNGKKDIGKKLFQTQIGYEMVVPIVSKDNTLNEISKDMLMNIYNRNIVDWKFIPINSTDNQIDKIVELNFDEDIDEDNNEINANPIDEYGNVVDLTYIQNWNFGHIMRGFGDDSEKYFMYIDNDGDDKYNFSNNDELITKDLPLIIPESYQFKNAWGTPKIGINNKNRIFIFGDIKNDNIYNKNDDCQNDQHISYFFDNNIPQYGDKALENAVIAKCNDTKQYFIFIDNNQDGIYTYEKEEHQPEKDIHVYSFRNENIDESVFCKFLFNLETLSQFEDIYINLDDAYKVNTQEEMIEQIADDPNGIGFVSYKYAKEYLDRIKILEYSNNGMKKLNSNEINSWPFKTSLNFITVNDPIGEVKELIDFCLQPDTNLEICKRCNLVSIYD